MLLNSDSYEFFLKQTRETEKKFFDKAELCGKEMMRVTNELEEIGFKPNTAQYDLSVSRRINLNIFSEAINQGEGFMVMSKKFITELEMMKDLSSNVMDEDLNFEDSVERENFLEMYTESIEKSIGIQTKVMRLILAELKMLNAIRNGVTLEDESDD